MQQPIIDLNLAESYSVHRGESSTSGSQEISKGTVIIGTSYPDHSVNPVEDNSNWVELYPDAE
jgi:hypothetical protein